MTPKVSVIVPNYNHAPYLRQRIDSILNQTYQDFELILLDDCSTDNSREILLSYKDNPHVTQVVFNEQNAGTAFKQWNKGISLAHGEFVWIAESDDWAKEDFLEVVMSELDSHPDCGLAYTLAHYMRDGVECCPQKVSGKVYYKKGNEFVAQTLAYGCVIYNVSMVVFKRTLFAKVDQSLYADMHLCGDWFFYTQICSLTNVIQIDSYHSFYRIHNSNVHNRAECEGCTILEGIRVLEYIEEKFGVSERKLIRYWGRAWVTYKKKYQFSNSVNNQICKYMRHKHLGIYLWYLVYCVRKRKKVANLFLLHE